MNEAYSIDIVVSICSIRSAIIMQMKPIGTIIMHIFYTGHRRGGGGGAGRDHGFSKFKRDLAPSKKNCYANN